MAVGRPRPCAPLDANAGDARLVANRHQGGARWQSRPRISPRSQSRRRPRRTRSQAPRSRELTGRYAEIPGSAMRVASKILGASRAECQRHSLFRPSQLAGGVSKRGVPSLAPVIFTLSAAAIAAASEIPAYASPPRCARNRQAGRQNRDHGRDGRKGRPQALQLRVSVAVAGAAVSPTPDGGWCTYRAKPMKRIFVRSRSQKTGLPAASCISPGAMADRLRCRSTWPPHRTSARSGSQRGLIADHHRAISKSDFEELAR